MASMMKRSRGRNRRPQHSINRAYDSNGPDVRVRGTAMQVYEKYQALARDAMSSGDRVMAENYQQHGEHYYRIMMSQMPAVPNNMTNGQASDQDAERGTEEKADDKTDDKASKDEGVVALQNGTDGEESADGANGVESEESADDVKPRRRGPLGAAKKAPKTEKAQKPEKTERKTKKSAEK